MQKVKYTFCTATPRAAVNQLNQYTWHVMGAQHAIDNTDAAKKRSILLMLAVEVKLLVY